MSDYDFRPGGALKLRGVAEGGIVKKKKHKSKSKPKTKEREKSTEAELVKELELLTKEDDLKSPSPSGSGRNSPAIASSSTASIERKTPAEKRFEEVQRKRLAEKVARLAHKTHKDRVHEFNSKLEALSEHHDIPKVGPG
ncbi:hypothetical protein FOMPIDRAFT_1048672 [Fomitopsis schrenkii]|uniref:DUF1754-domain-containing protein n=1 Tax=Fomitopsis schrenkii TaxID=2126942 RepID=S8FJC9_FOMSC|nr:hypothetical protein FOMPIDRAFT_1048672 [Fomitopsis schrenkii]